MRTILWLVLLMGAAQAAEPTYYAETAADGTVLRVIVADAAFIAKQPGTWVQTFMDGSGRKNYAGIGYKHDKTIDAFVPPKPFKSWTLDTATAQWAAPVKIPLGMKFPTWDEAKQQWSESTLATENTAVER